MDAAEFEHDVTKDDVDVTVRLRGELDLTTIPLMKAALRALRGDERPLIVDLEQLDFAGVRGTRSLADELAALRTVRPVAVVNVPRRIHRVAALLRVAHHLRGERAAL
jgi:anti-anti-sigma factor